MKKPSLNLRIDSKVDMNVFIYQGVSGTELITQKILQDDSQVEVGQTYSIDADMTIFIIAYPNILKDKTELKITYWIDEMSSGGTTDVKLWHIGVYGSALIALLIVCAFLFFCYELFRRCYRMYCWKPKAKKFEKGKQLFQTGSTPVTEVKQNESTENDPDKQTSKTKQPENA